MSPFTDDDLKRLKSRATGVMTWETCEALLARLETAEAIVIRWNEDVLVDKVLFEAWFRASGRK